jgi:hypothetical protein
MIPPNATKGMHVVLRVLKAPTGRIEQTVLFHTDHPTAPSLAATVSGRVAD